MKKVLSVFLLAIALGAQGSAFAQADKAAMQKADAPATPKSAARRAGVDARECLKLSTNMEIHRCALKYR